MPIASQDCRVCGGEKTFLPKLLLMPGAKCGTNYSALINIAGTLFSRFHIKGVLTMLVNPDSYNNRDKYGNGDPT